MTSDPKWVSRNQWSGLSILGDNKFDIKQSDKEWDVVCAAVCYPEGGAYDTFVSYDGTAVTWGFVQWTFTSLRLQKLLRKVELAQINGFTQLCSVLKDTFNCYVAQDGTLRNYASGKEIKDKTELRSLFTPPDGCLPKTGKNFEAAKKLSLAFYDLGQGEEIKIVQKSFFFDELSKEVTYSRPNLKNKSIEYYLYSNDAMDLNKTVTDYYTPSRALFWSMWQNSPRKAEEHLFNAFGPRQFDGSETMFKKLCNIFAKSQFGNWGNAKAKETGRESRYHKTANTINKIIGRNVIDADIK